MVTNISEEHTAPTFRKEALITYKTTWRENTGDHSRTRKYLCPLLGQISSKQYLIVRFLPLRKHAVYKVQSCNDGKRSVLLFYFENQMKPKNDCGQHAELLNVEAGGTHSYHYPVKNYARYTGKECTQSTSVLDFPCMHCWYWCRWNVRKLRVPEREVRCTGRAGRNVTNRVTNPVKLCGLTNMVVESLNSSVHDEKKKTERLCSNALSPLFHCATARKVATVLADVTRFSLVPCNKHLTTRVSQDQSSTKPTLP